MVEKGINDLIAVKNNYQVPQQLYSCHTAVVDGYVIEGHVPAAEISRLLAEKPDVAGLAVPGMPIGSPGMETPGMADEAYSVFIFNLSCYLKNMAEAHGQNKQADLEFKAHIGYCMDTLRQDALN